jgi:hypothetical protein
MDSITEIEQVNEHLFFNASLTLVQEDKETTHALTTEFDYYTTLFKIEKLIHELKNDDILHHRFWLNCQSRLQLRQVHGDRLGKKFLALLLKSPVSPIAIQTKNPSHAFHPSYLLFIGAIKRYQLDLLTIADLHNHQGKADVLLNQLNACVQFIQKKAQSLKFAKKCKSHNRSSLKNLRGCFRLVDHLFRQRSRLLVVRIDLGYLRNYKYLSNDLSAVSKHEFFEHRANFIKSLGAIFRNNELCAYIVKTEFKPQKTFHHHVVIFLDGSRVRQGISIAEILGKNWNNVITQGRGVSINLNEKYAGQDNCYIGMIHRSDTAMISNLKERVIGYICKPDYYYRFVAPLGQRAFCKSEIKEKITEHKKSKAISSRGIIATQLQKGYPKSQYIH